MDRTERELRELVERHARGEIPAGVALARVVVLSRGVDAARTALARCGAGELARLLEENADGCRAVAHVAHEDARARAGPASRPEERIARTARLFDRCVRRSEEASVALYSLGSPERLAAAADEIVRLFGRWGVLGPDRDALDLGCGIGRVARPIAPRVRRVHGVDVSPRMVRTARRRCAAVANASFSLGSGADLAPWPDACFDLVYAVDSMPYIVDAGDEVVSRVVADVVRVLRPGGELVVLNWSYRPDVERDRSDARRLATRFALRVDVCGDRLLSLWDGVAFRMRKPPRPFVEGV